MAEISDNTDNATGEFLFLEIMRENNIVIGNIYRSRSNAANLVWMILSILKCLCVNVV